MTPFRKSHIEIKGPKIGLWRRAPSQAAIEAAMGDVFTISPKEKIANTGGDMKRRAIGDS